MEMRDITTDSDNAERPHIEKYTTSEYLQTPATDRPMAKRGKKPLKSGVAHEEPLSAFMVQPQYLPKRPRTRVAPKRPLGPRTGSQPVHLHNQVATFGDVGRIRRSRVIDIPISADSTVRTENSADRLKGYMAAGAAAIAAALVFVGDKVVGAGHFIVSKIEALPFFPHRSTYSVREGAKDKYFGLVDPWYKVAVPLVLLACLLGIGVLTGLIGNKAASPGGQGGGKGSGQGGNAIIQVTPSSDNATGGGTKNQTQGSQGTSGGTAAGGANGAGAAQPTAGAPSGTAGSSGTAASGGGAATGGIGGYGGGGGGISTGSTGNNSPVYVSSPLPTVTTGSNTVTQAAPVPSSSPAPTPTTTTSGGSGGGSTGGSGGSTLPLNPTTPLPTTVTVPSTNVSSGGKTLLNSSGTSLTLN